MFLIIWKVFLLEYYSIEEFFASALGPVGTLGLLFGRLLGFIDPLVIDLDGDGVNTTYVTVSGVTFDLDNNGTEEDVGWFEAEDGILVQDWKGAVDENGNIIGDGEAQDRSELFATFDELSRHDLNETPLDVEDNGNIINSESTVTFADGSTAVINGMDLFRDTINYSYVQQIRILNLPSNLISV